MNVVLYFIAVGVAFVGYWVYISRRNIRAQEIRRSLFVSRQTLPQTEWFRLYFSDCGIDESTAVALFNPIAIGVGCELTQLHPEDSFNETLAYRGVMFLGFDDDDPLSDYAECDLPQAVAGESRANRVVEQVRSKPTLREIALAVARTK